VNVEHLLDVFTSIDANSEYVWGRCAQFMNYLHLHKPRLVALGPKIEALLDDHPSKPRCLWELSSLFRSVGNWAEAKRILTHILKLRRERGSDFQVAITLGDLSDVNRVMGLCKEGTQQAMEGSEILKRLGDATGQAKCLIILSQLLLTDGQLDTTEEAASRVIDLLPEKGNELRVCEGHRTLGNIYQKKGDTEKAIHHFKLGLAIASSLNFHWELFWAHFSLADLFFQEGRFNDAYTHVKQAKSHAVDDTYLLGRVSWLQARYLDQQHMFEEAKSEALRALSTFEKLGATEDAEVTRRLLGEIDCNAMDSGIALSDKPADDGELIKPTLLVCINFSCSDGITDTGDKGPNTHWAHCEHIESIGNM